MNYRDAIDGLTAVLTQAKLADKLCQMIDTARRVDENSISSLDRVLRERRELVELLRELGIRNRETFDYAFKHGCGPVHALREHLKLGNGAPVVDSVRPDDGDDAAKRFEAMEMR